MQKFKVHDKIKIVAGKDKGREGVIEQIFPKKSTALVPGVNLYKRRLKKALARDGKGGTYSLPRPLGFAKIALICPNCKKITRVGFDTKDGKKVRICRKCSKVIDKRLKLARK